MLATTVAPYMGQSTSNYSGGGGASLSPHCVGGVPHFTPYKIGNDFFPSYSSESGDTSGTLSSLSWTFFYRLAFKRRMLHARMHAYVGKTTQDDWLSRGRQTNVRSISRHGWLSCCSVRGGIYDAVRSPPPTTLSIAVQ